MNFGALLAKLTSHTQPSQLKTLRDLQMNTKIQKTKEIKADDKK